MSLCHCGNVPQAHARRVAGGGGWRRVGGRFRVKVWSHWILLFSQAHTQDRYPAAAGGKMLEKYTEERKCDIAKLFV